MAHSQPSSAHATQPPTAFVIDDDAAARDSIRWLLESVQQRVETFASAAEFLSSWKPWQRGCVVLDVRMPGMSGLELQDWFVAHRIDLPIIFVTGHGDVSMAVRAMRNGAVDFLEKPFNDQALIERVRNAIELDRRQQAARAEHADTWERYAQLTPREREVMQLVIDGLPSKEIATSLDLSQKTVEVHRAHIMRKLGVRGVADLVRVTVAAGLANRASPPPSAETRPPSADGTPPP